MQLVCFAIALAMMLSGCGSAAAPAIDDLEMPRAASAGSDGFYSVQGLLSFHDDVAPVNKIRIQVPSVAQSYDFEVGGGLTRGTLPLVVKFSSRVPKGKMAYQVALLDASGNASVPRAEAVVLQ